MVPLIELFLISMNPKVIMVDSYFLRKTIGISITRDLLFGAWTIILMETANDEGSIPARAANL